MLNNLHRKALVSAEKRREDSMQQANQHRRDFKGFEVGDYVLRAAIEGSSLARSRNKLQTKWVGPYQVIEPKSKKTYICKDLLTGVLYELHADHLYQYADQSFVATGKVKKQLAFDTLGRKPDRIVDFKLLKGKPIVSIKWKGVATSQEDKRKPWHPLELALFFWSLPQVLQQLAKLSKNQEAVKYVEKFAQE
jgi:hypothetical protein